MVADFETHPVGTARAYDLMRTTLRSIKGVGPLTRDAINAALEVANETAASRSYR